MIPYGLTRLSGLIQSGSWKQGSFWGFSQNDKMLSLKDMKLKQVKPGFTNYQPRGLANQIKFEV